MKKWIGLLLVISFYCTDAAAEEGSVASSVENTDYWRIGMGGRVGGYGFRQVNEEGNLDFENCRMNGMGIFLTSEFGEHAYSELAVDFYHTIAEPQRNGVDRLSVHTTLALGLKFLPHRFISPLVEVGGGVELTSAEVYGVRQDAIAPIGFLGIGGELNFGDLKAGMAIRTNAMQVPEYGWNESESLQWRTEVAGQAIFWMRYVL